MQRTHLSPETRTELGKMLMAGVTPTKAAAKLGVTVGHAVRMRSKLVDAGTIEKLRMRKKKSSKKKGITKERKHRVSSMPAFTFRVNGVDFSIDQPKKVIVENGIVDIKY